MKSSIIIDQLAPKHIETLSLACPPKVFNTETEIIYEGHVPTAGYLLLEGEIQFLKRKRIVKVVQAGTIFGVSELMNNTVLKYTVKILQNSKVCILDRSTVKELLQNLKTEELPHILRSVVAS